MSITNATNFRKKVFEYINSAVELNDVVNITTKNGNAVLINEEEYNSLVETAYLMSIPNMREKIVEGLNTPIEECVELDWENEL